MEEKLKMLAIQLKETDTDFAAVRNCLDEIIGAANYCVEYSDPQIVKTGFKENFIVKCRISILDDNRSVIMVRELYSANEITYKDQAPVNLTNALVRAQEEAFKRTCLSLQQRKVLLKKAFRSPRQNQFPLPQQQRQPMQISLSWFLLQSLNQWNIITMHSRHPACIMANQPKQFAGSSW